jgi:hypothetical protein
MPDPLIVRISQLAWARHESIESVDDDTPDDDPRLECADPAWLLAKLIAERVPKLDLAAAWEFVYRAAHGCTWEPHKRHTDGEIHQWGDIRENAGHVLSAFADGSRTLCALIQDLREVTPEVDWPVDEGVPHAREVSPSSPEKRRWTQDEVNIALTRFLEHVQRRVRALCAAIERGEAGAKGKWVKHFGRNALARKLGCSLGAISASPVYRALTRRAGLERADSAYPRRQVGLEEAAGMSAARGDWKDDEEARDEALDEFRGGHRDQDCVDS